jgi:hypothetical protein
VSTSLRLERLLRRTTRSLSVFGTTDKDEQSLAEVAESKPSTTPKLVLSLNNFASSRRLCSWYVLLFPRSLSTSIYCAVSDPIACTFDELIPFPLPFLPF